MKYFNIYKKLLIFNFANLTAYRANFVNSFISSIAWGIFSVVSVLLITSKTPVVFGWKREEILILTGIYSLFIGIFHMFFSRNFERFAIIVYKGELDFILLKPLDTQFSLGFWVVNYTSIFRILFGIAFTFYMINVLNLTINILQILAFLFLVFMGIILLFSIWFLIVSLTIWFPTLTNLVDLMYTVSGFARQPPEMFKEFSLYVFLFLLPLTIMVVSPVKSILGKLTINDFLISFLFAVFFLFLSRFFLKFALRFYTSSGG